MSRTPTTHLVIAGLASLVVPVALVAASGTPAAQAADPTCDGKPATIVGPGTRTTVTGTEGPDVIVTNNASDVDARGGDDTVCVTGVVGVGRSVDVVDGTGDDLVLNQATYVSAPTPPAGTYNPIMNVYLREGDDRFVGNGTPEVVLASSGDDDLQTAGGNDDVFLGGNVYGDEGLRPFGGRVDLGTAGAAARGDRVYLDPARVAPTTTLVARGPRATVGLSQGESGRWSIDAATGAVSRDGALRFRVDGFTHYDWFRSDDVVFRGTARGEHLIAKRVRTASFGAGDDQLTASSVTGVVDAGAGDDSVVVHAVRASRTARVLGGSGADVIRAGGAVSAGPGNDRVFGRATADRISGGPGNDLLVGNRGADALRGGPGRDVTRGGGGRDLCRAERTVACER